MMANITPEGDTNIKSTEYELEGEGVVSGEGSQAEYENMLDFFGSGGEIVKKCFEKMI